MRQKRQSPNIFSEKTQKKFGTQKNVWTLSFFAFIFQDLAMLQNFFMSHTIFRWTRLMNPFGFNRMLWPQVFLWERSFGFSNVAILCHPLFSMFKAEHHLETKLQNPLESFNSGLTIKFLGDAPQLSPALPCNLLYSETHHLTQHLALKPI